MRTNSYASTREAAEETATNDRVPPTIAEIDGEEVEYDACASEGGISMYSEDTGYTYLGKGVIKKYGDTPIPSSGFLHFFKRKD